MLYVGQTVQQERILSINYATILESSLKIILGSKTEKFPNFHHFALGATTEICSAK